MNLRKDEIKNRLNDLMDEGRGLMRRVADDVGTNARDVAFKARKEMVRGRRALVSAEESITRQAKDHPMAFVFIGFALASLVTATILLGRSQTRD